jgi:hypothetical protein
MAELVDALDSGSSRGNSVDVRVILAAILSFLLELDLVIFLCPPAERCSLQLNEFLRKDEKIHLFEIHYAGVCLSRPEGQKKIQSRVELFGTIH